MSSKRSTKKGKTVIHDNSSEHSDRRTNKHTLEGDDPPDTTIVSSSRRRKLSSTSRDTMGRSTSPAEVNRTRTGRVSKAAKGQPVHHCHCGKTYTRAEHLRRHQQNHKPGAFPCDLRGCERAFYREDLLARHKMKHDEPLGGSPTFLASRGLGDEPDLLAPSRSRPDPYQSEADPQEVAPIPELDVCDVDSRASHQQSGTGARKDYIPITELQPQAIGLTVNHAPVDFSRQSSWGLDLLPSCPFGSGYNTPDQAYQTYGQLHLPQLFDASQSWTTDTSSFYASHSPASRNSTTPTPLGRRTGQACSQLRTPGSDISICNGRDSFASFGTPYPDGSSGVDFVVVPEYRDLLEQDELVTPTHAPQAANFGLNQYHHRTDNEQRYLDAFWRCAHPAWPILHKPTFDPTRAPPLLRAAMVTIGAHSTGHPIDSGNACILHKRCLKVIRKRTIDQSHSYRADDMRAVFFVELFALTRSRRPSLQVSKPFVDTYHHLAREYDTDTTNAFIAAINSFDSLQGTPASTCTFEAECTRRLLAAYHMLDMQHNTFFGREATEIPDFDPSTFSLPQPLHLWDTTYTPQAAFYGETQCEHFVPQSSVHEATAGTQPLDNPLDIFTSTLLIAYTNNSKSRETPPYSFNSTQTLSSSYSKSAHTHLAHQTFALSAAVPIRALLAVAGESWIQAEKCGSKAEYVQAQANVREWATTTGAASATTALPLAVEILRLHRAHPKTTFFFHEWSLHLAILVVWAGFYAGRGRGRERHWSLSVPVPASLGVSSGLDVGVPVSGFELDGVLARLVNVGSGAGIEWQDAKRLLMWARGRMDKAGIARFCGVVSGAVNVLAALVDRGDEDEWF